MRARRITTYFVSRDFWLVVVVVSSTDGDGVWRIWETATSRLPGRDIPST